LALPCDVIDEVMDCVILVFAHDVNKMFLGGQKVHCPGSQHSCQQRVVLGQSVRVDLKKKTDDEGKI
jgi:hypothetical protein